MRRLKGFTLIELIIVIAIIGILAGAMVPLFRGSTAGARDAKTKAELDAFKSATAMYHADVGAWPNAVGCLTAAGGAANWNGPYIDRTGADPWGENYTIFCESAGGNLWIKSPNGSNAATFACAAADISCSTSNTSRYCMMLTSNSSS